LESNDGWQVLHLRKTGKCARWVLSDISLVSRRRSLSFNGRLAFVQNSYRVTRGAPRNSKTSTNSLETRGNVNESDGRDLQKCVETNGLRADEFVDKILEDYIFVDY